MRRSSRVPWGEVRVGVVVVFAFAVLMWAAFNGTGMSFFKVSHELNAYFDDVNGLVAGSPVWLGGIEVGHVSHIQFVEMEGKGKIRVTFEVKETAWPLVSDASKVAIGTVGLMGDKYISVSVRQASDPPATPGATLDTRTSGDLTNAFANAPDMMSNLSATLGHLNTILGRVEKGEGFVGRMTTNGKSSDDIDSLVASSRRLLADLNTSQKRLVDAVDAAADSFDVLSHGVLHGGGTLSKLVWDSSLYVQFGDVARRANSLMTRFDSDSGTLGKLAADSAMYVQMRDVIADTRKLIEDITAHPRKYFKFSVF
ncbi:MAG: MCE family protein [candidate division Zixibacteria bacterium]|nr:MCE family protein [candidate division Zixibacteria bacterium]